MCVHSCRTFRCLSYLNLDHNDLSGQGIVGLRDLPHLSVLRLNSNRVTSLLPALDSADGGPGGPSPRTPRYFAQLEVLQLGFNHITDMAALGLDRLPELKVLYLHGNDIQRVTGLNACSCLRELVLDKNKIKHIEASSFIGLEELRELRLQVRARR